MSTAVSIPRRAPALDTAVGIWLATCEAWARERCERFGLPYAVLWVDAGVAPEMDEETRNVYLEWHSMSQDERAYWQTKYSELLAVPDAFCQKERKRRARIDAAELQMRTQHR